MSHYDYLDREFMPFYHRICEAEGVQPNHAVNEGIIVAHGDKCYSSQNDWEEHGLAFEQGVAIYLLSYIYPWAGEVRDTPKGWVDVKQWVVDNKDRFLPYLSKRNVP